MNWTALVALTSCAAFSVSAFADEIIPMYKIDEKGLGEIIGTIKLSDSAKGLVLAPSLRGLSPGAHGFHVHENGACGAKEKDGKMVIGLAAGGHFDPAKVGKHEGPSGHGHIGDLPALEVAPDGSATKMITAEHLKLADLNGRSLMIHEGGDNYADQPKPLGGGGGRIACGVIK